MKLKNIDLLKTSLNYLHVSELKEFCEKLTLFTKGKKPSLIARILHFLTNGEKLESPLYPANSLAKNKKIYELKKDAIMLKGAYKNDLKTRIFFKNLIGPHFHFTAFGIDWLEEKWLAGTPPTYQEFANMWKHEYEFRKVNGSTPKEEWAYINFVKNYVSKNTKAGRKEILEKWELERLKHKNLAIKILAEFL
jgi:hypothetical protein